MLDRQKFSLGLWNVLSDSQAIRAASPYIDFVIVDLEHGFRNWSEIVSSVLEARSRSLSVWIRLRSYDDSAVQNLLDLGVFQFIVPQVRHLWQIDNLRSRLDYPPKGVRGQHPRASHGFVAADSTDPIGPVQLCVIFETKSILAIADEVLDHSGVDSVYLGTYDLSAELELPLGPNSPQLEALLGPVVGKAQSMGKTVIAMNGDKGILGVWKGLGVRTFVVGIDSEILQSGVQNSILDFESGVEN